MFQPAPASGDTAFGTLAQALIQFQRDPKQIATELAAYDTRIVVADDAVCHAQPSEFIYFGRPGEYVIARYAHFLNFRISGAGGLASFRPHFAGKGVPAAHPGARANAEKIKVLPVRLAWRAR